MKYNYVLKFDHEKELPEVKRITTTAQRFWDHILKAGETSKKLSDVVAIETPIFSWGRKNPVGFAKNANLCFYLQVLLNQYKWDYVLVNNKAAKKAAGYGGKDKEGMIEAYFKATGSYPGHSTKYGRETLADAFFIAKAGYGLRSKS